MKTNEGGAAFGAIGKERSKLLAMIMVMALMVVGVSIVASNGGNDVDAVVHEMPEPVDGVITLTELVALQTGYTVPEGVEEINLNGQKITSTLEGYAITIPSGSDVLIRNGTINAVGGGILAYGDLTLGSDLKITITGAKVNAVKALGSELTVDGAEIDNRSGFGIVIGNSDEDNTIDSIPSKLVFNSGSVECCYFAVSTNNLYSAGCTIDINGGTFESTDSDCPAIYLPAMCEVTIDNATITGASGIEMKMGDLTIGSGTIINATGEYKPDYVPAPGGAGANGSAINIGAHQYGSSEGQAIDVTNLHITIQDGAVLNSVNANSVDVFNMGLNDADVLDVDIDIEASVDSVRIVNNPSIKIIHEVPVTIADAEKVYFDGSADVEVSGDDVTISGTPGDNASLTIKSQSDDTPINITWEDFDDNGKTVNFVDSNGEPADPSVVAVQTYSGNVSLGDLSITTTNPSGISYTYDGTAKSPPVIEVTVENEQISTSGFLMVADPEATGAFQVGDQWYYWTTGVSQATIWSGTEIINSAVDAGTYTVRFGYAIGGTVNVVECSWTIDRATLTISAGINKEYDGTELVAGYDALVAEGLADGDSLTGGIISTTGSMAKTYTTEGSGWTLKGLATANGIDNYVVEYGSISLQITKRELTIAVDADKVYDGEVFEYDASGATITGLVDGESVSGTLTTSGSDAAIYDEVGSGSEVVSTVTVSSGRVNYNITYQVSLEITKKSLTITGVMIAEKDYDGTTDATVTGVTFDGLIGEDSLTLGTDYTASGVFDDADAGNDRSVTIIVSSNDTDAIRNYSLPTEPFTITGQTISKATITITGASVPGKEYDGTGTWDVDSVTFGGTVGDESLVMGTDFTVSTKPTYNYNAGDAPTYTKYADVTVTLADNLNYAFEDGKLVATLVKVSTSISPIELDEDMIKITKTDAENGISVTVSVESNGLSTDLITVTLSGSDSNTVSGNNPFTITKSGLYIASVSINGDRNWTGTNVTTSFEVDLNAVNYYTKSTINGKYELEQTDVGSSVRTPNATNIPDGYILAGWSTTENGAKVYGVDVNIDVPVSGLDLYAVYVEDTGDVDPEPSGPTVTIDIPDSFAVGEEIEFSVSTTRGDYTGGYVQGTGIFEGIPGVDYIIWYKEDIDGKWYLWEDGNFGPSSGFPLSDATSEFRILFINAGTYDLTVQIVTVEGGDVVCETTAVVDVPAESTLGYHVIDAADFVYTDDAADYNANAYEYAADLSADANGIVAAYGSEYYDALVAYIMGNATDNQKAMAASVMNDFARYMGALYHSSDGDVGRVYFNGTEYVWKADADGDWLHGSNWRDASGVSLTSVVTDYIEATQNTRIVMEIAVPGGERQVLTYGAVFENAPAPEVQYYDVTITGEGVAIYIDGLRYFPGTHSMAEGEHTIGVEVLSGYTGTPVITNVTDGKFTVSGDMTIAISGVTAVVDPEPEKELPGIEFDMPVFIAGQDDAFRVTFIANDYVGQTVTVKATFSGDSSDITSILYWNVNINDWDTMVAEDDGSYVYGGSGFTLSDATSAFRATFANAGVYTLTVHISIEGKEITRATETFIVEEAVVAEYYNVTFNVDGNTSTVRVLAGEYVLLATPSKDGYTFGGWYVEGDDATLYTLYYTPSDDVTLIAKFTENQVITEQTYSVAFGEVHTQDGLKAGDVVTMPVVTPEENYRLVGWETENGIVLTGQQYYVYAADDADEDSTITLKPVFEKYVFTVTVSGGENGTIGTETFSVEMGGTAVITGIQADPGYYVESVTATGGYTVVDFNGSYVIFDVAEDITVTVAFAADPGAMDITMTAELTEGGVLVTMRSNDGGDLPTGIIQIVYSYTVYDSELGINVPEFRTIEIDYTAVGQTGTTQFVEMTFEPTATFAHAEFMVGEEVRAQSGYFRAFLES